MTCFVHTIHIHNPAPNHILEMHLYRAHIIKGKEVGYKCDSILNCENWPSVFIYNAQRVPAKPGKRDHLKPKKLRSTLHQLSPGEQHRRRLRTQPYAQTDMVTHSLLLDQTTTAPNDSSTVTDHPKNA